MDLGMDSDSRGGTPGVGHRASRRLACLGRRAGTAAALAAALALVAGCSDIEYYWQGIAGQTDLLARAKPIPEVIATTSDAALKGRLLRAQEIRAFASRELGLPDNRSYTSYADLGRPYAVWNVFAAPELSLTPRQWCFPVAGCVNYRGYFSEADARAEAARLSATGDDVNVSGIPAYSTLGYFDDPVLSTFVRYREIDLARLIFHELAHQVVYVKDDTSFNESFAVAVEEAGVARWLAHEARVRGESERETLAAELQRGRELRAEFRKMIGTTRERLTALYASDASDEEKRAGKREAFAALRAEYEAQKAATGGGVSFDRWFAAGANNAGIAAMALYADRVPQFTALLAAENGDLPRFYARVKALGVLPPAEREPALLAAVRH
jgi:predicted aminopeptidase